MFADKLLLNNKLLAHAASTTNEILRNLMQVVAVVSLLDATRDQLYKCVANTRTEYDAVDFLVCFLRFLSEAAGIGREFYF